MPFDYYIGDIPLMYSFWGLIQDVLFQFWSQKWQVIPGIFKLLKFIEYGISFQFFGFWVRVLFTSHFHLYLYS